MKNKSFIGIAFIVYALALAVGPYTLYQGCEKGDMLMACHKSLSILLGLGILVGIIGILVIITKLKNVILISNIIGLVAGVFAILIPSVIVGGCKMETMPCRTTTFPVIYVVSGIFIVINLVSIFFQLKQFKGSK